HINGVCQSLYEHLPHHKNVKK
ncbi:hypothetical protein ACOI3B_27490, partial [Acinetobacter baumannii]